MQKQTWMIINHYDRSVYHNAICLYRLFINSKETLLSLFWFHWIPTYPSEFPLHLTAQHVGFAALHCIQLSHIRSVFGEASWSWYHKRNTTTRVWSGNVKWWDTSSQHILRMSDSRSITDITAQHQPHICHTSVLDITVTQTTLCKPVESNPKHHDKACIWTHTHFL